MKTDTTAFDLTVQSAILGLGRMLATRSAFRHPPAMSGSCKYNANLKAEIERVLAIVHTTTARRRLGILQKNTTKENTLRLSAVAYIGWQMVGEAAVMTQVVSVAAAVVSVLDAVTSANTATTVTVVHAAAGESGESFDYCENYLLVRDCLARMVCGGLLTVMPDQSRQWDGRLLLPPRTFAWLCGGPKSQGDFSLVRIDNARLHRDADSDEKSDASEKIPTAKQLFERVRKQVVGLDPQIKAVASRIALHLTRLELMRFGTPDTAVGNIVILVTGASGSGKSFLAECTALAAGLPFAQIDCTTLTASGYSGGDIDDIYKLLLTAANGDIRAATQGIVFLDEFDKKCSHRSGGADNRDVGGESVQMELLSRLQSSATPFMVGGKRANDGFRPFLFDGRTTGYILAGVFAGLDEVIDRMSGRRGIGYVCRTNERQQVLITDALKEMGFLDELVNRIGLIVRLPDPSAENIMKATHETILQGFNQLLVQSRIALSLTKESVREIGEFSMQTKTFYRGAKQILAAFADEVLFDQPKGPVLTVRASDVRRVAARLSTGNVIRDIAAGVKSREVPGVDDVDLLSDKDADTLDAEVARG